MEDNSNQSYGAKIVKRKSNNIFENGRRPNNFFLNEDTSIILKMEYKSKNQLVCLFICPPSIFSCVNENSTEARLLPGSCTMGTSVY